MADSLTFRTRYFDAGTGSVLHSGIYNREFSSMLASVAAAGLTYMALVNRGGSGWPAFAGLLGVALITFPLFRRYVFREQYLRTVFDKTQGRVSVFREGLYGRVVEDFPLAEIGNVLIETKRTVVENTDGVEFVKKISLQHHTAIPGFGEENALYLLTLKLAGGRDLIIFAGESMEDAISAHAVIKKFIENI